jgi:hypothetical protein
MIKSQKVSLGRIRQFLNGLSSHDDRDLVEINIVTHNKNDVTMTFTCGNDNVVFAFTQEPNRQQIGL